MMGENFDNYVDDPKKTNEQFVHQYQESSRTVQDIFNSVDPLGDLKDTAEGYTGCTELFMNQLGNQQITDLTRDQIETMVRNSFKEGQVGTSVSEDKIEKIVNHIDVLNN